MKVLFAGYGSRGDVQPMLALALRAKSEGYHAIVAAPRDFRDFVEGFGLEFRPVGVDARKFVAEVPDIATHGTIRSLRRFQHNIDAHLTELFHSLDAACEGIDVIVAGAAVVTASSIAERRKIPYCNVMFCPAGLHSAEHAPMVVPWTGLPRWLNRALWRFFLLSFGWSAGGRVLGKLRRKNGLPPARNIYRHITGRNVILAADASLAPVPRDSRLGVVHSSHEELQEPKPLAPRIEAFLAAGEAPVFIGFGSMPDDKPERTTRIIAEAVRRTGRRAILSRGWANLGDMLSDDRILVIDDAPHATLFPRVAAVVHHGGAGTTHTAARAGVPQVVVPHLMDQGYWAERVRVLGLGPKSFARKQLNADRLNRAIASAITHKDNAQRFAQQMRHAPPVRELLSELALT